MKIVVLFFCFLALINSADAQRIRVNGDVTNKAELPVAGVAVMAFDKGTMIKSYVTDEKGQFSFYVDKIIFDVLFYKPGMLTHSYGVYNKLDKDIQGIYINTNMEDSTGETVVNIDSWLKRHDLTPAQLDTIYATELKKRDSPSPRQQRHNEKLLVKAAEKEQKRFSNYKESTVEKSVDNKESEVTTTRIGPDIYKKITDDKGGSKYMKNNKPITYNTYSFETTRRYEGVLKSSDNVKRFDKYKPMEHVKGKEKEKD
jgi:hypothetical protein